MEELTKLKKRKIKIEEGKTICLNEQTLFLANGEEGLHLWESAIVFSRFICKFPEMFENKNVIELGCGCGLLGLTCLMYTKCANLTFSDYQNSVLENLVNNLEMNKQQHNHLVDFNNINDNPGCTGCFPGRYSLFQLDWRDYEKYKVESYDLIIGSELIYNGGHIEELAKMIRSLLSLKGKALITMPEKRSMTKPFLKYLEENELECSFKSIEEYPDCQNIFDSPLTDEKEAKKLFENLKSLNIILYEITRRQ